MIRESMPEEYREAPDARLTVSVVVPCKNDARFLTSNLESILSQEYCHIECIVVDGGSTDATIDLLRRYGERIRWVSEPDRGAFDAINRGWQLATGDILAWLNADDLWEPGAVRKIVDVFKRRQDVDVVYGTAGVIDEIGRIHGDLVPRAWDLEYALRHCDHIIFQPAAFMRRSILERVGWLYPAWCHDHDLWLRIASAGGTFAKIPDRLAMDRLRMDNLGRVGELVIPAKIGLTRRFFADTTLPPEIRRLRRYSMSGAYVRSLDYLRGDSPGDWVQAVRLVSAAVVMDPGNVRAIGQRALRPFRERLPRLRADLRRVLVRTPRAAVGLIRYPMTLASPYAGSIVERIFRRGNREIISSVRHIQKSVNKLQDRAKAVKAQQLLHDAQLKRIQHEHRRLRGAVEELRDKADKIDAYTQALPTSLGIDSIASAVPKLMEAIAQQDDELRNLLETNIGAFAAKVHDDVEVVHREQEMLRAQLQEKPPARISDTLTQVYGTPPTLRPIPGWHTYWNTDNDSDPFLQARHKAWSSLKNPVAMRWLGDLLVLIWPGNELSRVLFLTGNFEPNELTWLTHTLTAGMVVIDVGAHMGMYTLVAAKLVGESGVIVAIEPSTREFQRLATHVELNDLRNVRCLQEAASDCVGEATLNIASEWNSGHNTFGDFFHESVEKSREERVRTRPIDAIVAAQQLDRVDVIKIDAEGHELRVLAGAVGTLRRFRPRILIEVFGKTLRGQGVSVQDVLSFLEEQGYELHEFSAITGEVIPLASFVGDESRNLVALPR